MSFLTTSSVKTLTASACLFRPLVYFSVLILIFFNKTLFLLLSAMQVGNWLQCHMLLLRWLAILFHVELLGKFSISQSNVPLAN